MPALPESVQCVCPLPAADLDQTMLLGGASQYWTRVLQIIADAPGEHGSGTRASDVGAVMK
eukprot:2205847-Prymnesium_polylepis.1